MAGLVPGLNPNIRLVSSEPNNAIDGDDFEIQVDDDPDAPQHDEHGNLLEIKHADGSITISLDGSPITKKKNDKPKEWFDNLVEDIDASEAAKIASDLILSIEDDIKTRQDWIEDRAQGIKLLGLKVEIPNLGAAVEGAPVEGMSRVRHPLLLEAVLRFQANARSELLPTDGPVKIRNDNNNAQVQDDMLGNYLEKDLNHYLTAVATEYYPDTDRMLLMLGFGGTAFKKVYFCPLRNRPVSETVDANDLIVNNSATDLRNAKRITHRVFMRQSTVKRLQILGVYIDDDLGTPMQPKIDETKREEKSQQGIAPNETYPNDRDREIYECYCELDLKGFEHEYKGEKTGLEIPYRVTIDRSSRKVLSIVRNYDEPDKDSEFEQLPEARPVFVKYTFTPGFGFYDIGLLHILGNTTNAVTAAWRELLDNGMFANFPGFLYADTGARQNTNIFRVPPGGGALIKTGGMPINQAVMPVPYNMQAAPALMGLVENIVETGMRVGGTSEQPVGEGRAEQPVGTTLALIEQAQKILNAVHKRLHASQAEEFQLLVSVFKEHPGSFWQRKGKMAYQWDETTFLQALENCQLVPQADPNTASYTQRIMKIMALKQLQQTNPTMYDPIAIDRAALRAIGWANPDQFLAPPAAQAAVPPEIQEAQAKLAIEKQKADAVAQLDMAKAQQIAHEMQNPAPEGGLGKAAGPTPEEMQLKQQDLALRTRQAQFEQQRASIEDENRDKDRQADLAMENARLVAEQMRESVAQRHEQALQVDQNSADRAKQQAQLDVDQAKHMLQLNADRDKQARDIESRPPPATPGGKPKAGGK